MPSPNIYSLAEKKSNEIEGELKRLNRWDDKPLPADKFKDMGAFGSNTMTFVQWLQFVLILRIRQIVSQGGDFPNNSMVGTYAIREFDGDHEAGSRNCFVNSMRLSTELKKIRKLLRRQQ